MKFLKFEFSSAQADWIPDLTSLKCTVSFKDLVETVHFSSSCEFEAKSIAPSDLIHIVLQNSSLVLSSQAFLLSKLLGKNMKHQFDQVVQMQASPIHSSSNSNLTIEARFKLELTEKDTNLNSSNTDLTECDLKTSELNDSDVASSCKDCDYLEKISKIEENLKKGKEKISYFKKELGKDFEKLLLQARNRESRSPTRSPTRGGLASQNISQKSLNASFVSTLRMHGSDFIEIPSSVELDLEMLSILNLDSLSNCAAGIVFKNRWSEVSRDEARDAVSASQVHENFGKIMEHAAQASINEAETEYRNYDTLISCIKETSESFSSSIENKRKNSVFLRHEKEKLEKDLKKLRENKVELLNRLQKTDLIQEIRKFSERQDELERTRGELEEKLIDLIEENKVFSEASVSELRGLEEDLKNLRQEIAVSRSECERLEYENKDLDKELSVELKKKYFSEELELNLNNYSEWAHNSSAAVDLIKKQVLRLRSEKLETSTSGQSQFVCLEKESKDLTSASAVIQKSISHHSETINELNKKLKSLKTNLSGLEEAFNKKESIESTFDFQFSKLKQSEKVQTRVLAEVNYFSDFVFHTSQLTLQHQRISEKVKQLLQSKNFEFQALRDAFSDFKTNNPVYKPIEADYIDQALADYLNDRDSVLPIPFKRESYGVYFFGSKKIMLKVEREKLIVKSGGGYMPVDQFIETYLVGEVDKQLKACDPREQTLEEKFLQYRAETPIIEEDI